LSGESVKLLFVYVISPFDGTCAEQRIAVKIIEIFSEYNRYGEGMAK
jgi:hypothetical protein